MSLPRTGQLGHGSASCTGGGPKKRFQYCLNPNSPEHFLVPSSNSRPFCGCPCWSYTARQRSIVRRLRRALACWELSRPALYHPVWVDSGRLKVSKKERQALFFTAVSPMCVDLHREFEYDLNNPRIAVYKNTWQFTKTQYHQSKESEEYGETVVGSNSYRWELKSSEKPAAGKKDFRIQGLLHSTVQKTGWHSQRNSLRTWSTNLKHTQIASRWWQT